MVKSLVTVRYTILSGWKDYKTCLVAVWRDLTMVENESRELLISKWFPITEVSVESVRERSTSQVPALNSLHVWFARKPLCASRAAILLSLISSATRRDHILRVLGIPSGVNMQEAQDSVIRAKTAGVKLRENPFKWKRAFKFTPSNDELNWLQSEFRKTWPLGVLVCDPMAGGGSIPYEAIRLGVPVIAGDLNPVAYICLKGVLEYPAKFGKRLIGAVKDFCEQVHQAATAELKEFFPEREDEQVYAYLWARAVCCSSCGLTVPLSTHWWIVHDPKDQGSIAVRLVMPETGDKCNFEIVKNPLKHGLDPDEGTAKGGRAECPRCHTVISAEEIKKEVQNAKLGHQLYAVCTKNRSFGRTGLKWSFRSPTTEELVAIEKADIRLKERVATWKTSGLVPDEIVTEGLKTKELLNFGVSAWYKLFSNRQLLTHLTYLEKFLLIRKKLFSGIQPNSEEWDFACAITAYSAMVFDRCVDNNCLLSLWNVSRTAIAHAMSLQGFPFKWNYAEWNQLVSGAGYDWALSKVLEALEEIVELLPLNPPKAEVYYGNAARTSLKDRTIPCIVVDPPYAENVMYAEVSDFFYVWLKRLLGDIFPETFRRTLTDKEEETVSNPARFKGMGRSAKKLAQEDYETKLEACFREMHRILQDNGVMTVMFTHRTAEAWSSLATALMNAGFTFISSWPVHTEPAGKYAKQGKGVLKVTVILACIKRKANHPGIWEHIADELRDVAKQKIEEFSKLGINGPDLKVSVYGPVLGKFADYYPVKTATGREIDPREALDQVTDVLNERFLQEAGIQNVDKETAAYINLLANFPTTETEYEEARLATVFGGLVTLDTLDVKGTYGFIEKDGKNVKILSARDRQAMGIIDPYDHKTLKTTIDHIHAAILQYERGGLIQVKRLMQDKNLDTAGSPFPTVLQAYARYAENSTNENFQKDAAIAKALLTALGKSIEFAPKKGERLDHYTSES
jgi:adenine-specific DNA methylase